MNVSWEITEMPPAPVCHCGAPIHKFVLRQEHLDPFTPSTWSDEVLTAHCENGHETRATTVTTNELFTPESL